MASASQAPRDLPRLSQFDWIAISTWSILTIGIAARLLRYGLRFPLWGDECLLAANFLDRGFLALLRPLNYHQVAPVTFLWLELAATKCLGFTEYSLRLVPLLAGITSPILLYRFAKRQLEPMAALFAVGFFAVSSYAIRHSAEVKPYAIDSLVTLILLSAAYRAWRCPERAAGFWFLAPLGGIAVLMSYPSVFVVGAISVVLLPTIWHAARPSLWLSFLGYNLTAAIAFLIVLASSAGPQFQAERQVMQDYWSRAFPPVHHLKELPLWLLDAHTGEMFAYPLGSEKGGSTLTFLCFAVGMVALWRRTDRRLASITLATLGLALFAAALGRYPYGGHPRLMQYVAPLICLVAGMGLTRILDSFRHPRFATAMRVGLVSSFLLIAVGLMVHYWTAPYQDYRDLQRLRLARLFWNAENKRPGPLLNISTSFHIDLYPRSPEAIYRCDERIYGQISTSPWNEIRRQVNFGVPLRCVAHHRPKYVRDAAAFVNWVATLENEHQLMFHQTSS